MAAKPTVFIGSSSEHLDIANTVQELLARDANVRVWDRAFDLGSGVLETLEAELDRADFAILVLAPDDITTSRDRVMSVPRDNVLFELGLFMGRLGRDRAYYLYDDGIDVKLPSDLAGITGATYARPASDDEWPTVLGPACNKIRRRLSAVKARLKLDAETMAALGDHQAFRDRVLGSWWEFLLDADPPTVSYVSITPDIETSTLRLQADGYTPDGKMLAAWESIGAILHVAERRICYTWKGWFAARPGEPYEGFGDIAFSGPNQSVDRGTGTYFNINVAKLDTTVKHSFRMQRCTDEDVKIMESNDKVQVRTLVGRLLGV